MGQWFNNNGGTLLGSFLSGLFNIGANAMQIKYQREANAQNIAMQRETNALNAKLVGQQNLAAMAESDKARQYDSASAQVSRLRAAGMSKAGALGAINGAGGYTPAPVNAAQAHAPQVQAPQIDLTGVSNAIQGFMQLREQKRQFNETMDLERQKFAEEQLNNAKVRDLQDAQISKIAKENEVSDASILKLFADTDLTYAQLRTEFTKYDLNVKQAALISEQTKLTAAQILQVKASTKLTQAQIETELSKKQLTDSQVKQYAKEYERIAQQVDEFMSSDAINQRKNERQLTQDILEFQRNITGDTATITRNQADKSERIENAAAIANQSTGGCVAMWSYLTEEIFGFLPFANKR